MQATGAVALFTLDAAGSEFSVRFNKYSEHVKIHIPGRHNIQNCLAAAGLCLAVVGAGVGRQAVAEGVVGTTG